MKIHKIFAKATDAVEKVILGVDIFLLFFITVVVVVQVVARYLGISLVGTEIIAQYSYVCFVFFAWSVAALRGTDIRVTIVFDRLPPIVRRILLGLYHLIMMAFCILVFRSALINTTKSVNSSVMWLKMSWLYYAVAVGSALTALFNMIRALRLWIGFDKYMTENEANENMIKSALDHDPEKLAEEAVNNTTMTEVKAE